MLDLTEVTSSYTTLVDSFEHEVILMREDDDYQGDSYYLLRDGDRLGILVFGWGSCSGCDALQGCCGLQEVIDLRDSLYESIKWFDGEGELRNYIADKEWETEWYFKRGAGTEFIRAITEWAFVVESRAVPVVKLLT